MLTVERPTAAAPEESEDLAAVSIAVTNQSAQAIEHVVSAALEERWAELDEILPGFSQDPGSVELARKWLEDHDDRMQRVGICVLQHSPVELGNTDIIALERFMRSDFINFGHAAIALAQKGVRTDAVEQALHRVIEEDPEIASAASVKLEEFDFYFEDSEDIE